MVQVKINTIEETKQKVVKISDNIKEWFINEKESDKEAKRVEKLPQVLESGEKDDDNMLKIAKLDELQTQFRVLEVKALRTDEENAELKALYVNAELIESAKNILLAEEEQGQSIEVQNRRLLMVEYFGGAMSVLVGENKEKIVQTVVELIKTDNFSVKESDWLKKSLAGDKIELLTLLKTYAPEKLEELLKDYENIQTGKLIGWYAGKIKA